MTSYAQPPRTQPPTDQQDVVVQLPVLRGLATLLRHRVLIAATGLAVLGLLVTRELMRPPQYTVSASFLTRSRRAENPMSLLATQLGFQVPRTNDLGPDAFAELVKSREVLRQIVDSPYVLSSGRTATFTEISGRRDAPLHVKRDAAIRGLQGAIEPEVTETGLVVVKTTTGDSALTRQVAERMLTQVNAFNLQMNQTQAGGERRFIEGRMAAAAGELRAAEAELLRFLETNRSIQASAKLTLESERLRREVLMRQEIYTTLAKTYEQAKIDEVRDSPVINVIEPPEAAQRVVVGSRWILRSLFLAGAVMFLAFVLSFVRDWFRGVDADEPIGITLSRLWGETKRDARHPIRAIRNARRQPARPAPSIG